MPCLLPSPEWEVDQMTDARFPDRWLTNRQILGLPSDAFRLFVIGNAWSVSNRTDGRLDATDLAMMPDPAAESDRCLLLQAGLWTKDDSGYVIADFLTFQTSAAQLASAEAKLLADRLRKAKPKQGRSDVPTEDPAEFHATAKDRTETGHARTGKAVTREIPSQRPRPLPDNGWD